MTIERHYKEGFMTYTNPPDPFEMPKENLNVDRAQLAKLPERVNHPSHYNQGKYEVIDVIEDWGLNFSEGNVVKYLARARHKRDRLEDLKKARWYLDYMIQQLEKENT